MSKRTKPNTAAPATPNPANEPSLPFDDGGEIAPTPAETAPDTDRTTGKASQARKGGASAGFAPLGPSNLARRFGAG